MALRIIHREGFCAETSSSFKVYWDSAYREYVVYYFVDGDRLITGKRMADGSNEPVSYHTNDREDAIATGKHWLAKEWDIEVGKVVGPIESLGQDM